MSLVSKVRDAKFLDIQTNNSQEQRLGAVYRNKFLFWAQLIHSLKKYGVEIAGLELKGTGLSYGLFGGPKPEDDADNTWLGRAVSPQEWYQEKPDPAGPKPVFQLIMDWINARNFPNIENCTWRHDLQVVQLRFSGNQLSSDITIKFPCSVPKKAKAEGLWSINALRASVPIKDITKNDVFKRVRLTVAQDRYPVEETYQLGRQRLSLMTLEHAQNLEKGFFKIIHDMTKRGYDFAHPSDKIDEVLCADLHKFQPEELIRVLRKEANKYKTEQGCLFFLLNVERFIYKSKMPQAQKERIFSALGSIFFENEGLGFLRLARIYIHVAAQTIQEKKTGRIVYNDRYLLEADLLLPHGIVHSPYYSLCLARLEELFPPKEKNWREGFNQIVAKYQQPAKAVAIAESLEAPQVQRTGIRQFIAEFDEEEIKGEDCRKKTEIFLRQLRRAKQNEEVFSTDDLEKIESITIHLIAELMFLSKARDEICELAEAYNQVNKNPEMVDELLIWFLEKNDPIRFERIYNHLSGNLLRVQQETGSDSPLFLKLRLDALKQSAQPKEVWREALETLKLYRVKPLKILEEFIQVYHAKRRSESEIATMVFSVGEADRVVLLKALYPLFIKFREPIFAEAYLALAQNISGENAEAFELLLLKFLSDKKKQFLSLRNKKALFRAAEQPMRPKFRDQLAHFIEDEMNQELAEVRKRGDRSSPRYDMLRGLVLRLMPNLIPAPGLKRTLMSTAEANEFLEYLGQKFQIKEKAQIPHLIARLEDVHGVSIAHNLINSSSPPVNKKLLEKAKTEAYNQLTRNKGNKLYREYFAALFRIWQRFLTDEVVSSGEESLPVLEEAFVEFLKCREFLNSEETKAIWEIFCQVCCTPHYIYKIEALGKRLAEHEAATKNEVSALDFRVMLIHEAIVVFPTCYDRNLMEFVLNFELDRPQLMLSISFNVMDKVFVKLSEGRDHDFSLADLKAFVNKMLRIPGFGIWYRAQMPFQQQRFDIIRKTVSDKPKEQDASQIKSISLHERKEEDNRVSSELFEKLLACSKEGKGPQYIGYFQLISVEACKKKDKQAFSTLGILAYRKENPFASRYTSRTCFQNACKIDPDDQAPLINLIEVCYELDDFQTIVEYFIKYLEAGNGTSSIQDYATYIRLSAAHAKEPAIGMLYLLHGLRLYSKTTKEKIPDDYIRSLDKFMKAIRRLHTVPSNVKESLVKIVEAIINHKTTDAQMEEFCTYYSTCVTTLLKK